VRLDVFLKQVGLVKQRSRAKEICDGGAVWVEGKKAKAGKEIDRGLTVTVELKDEILELKIIDLPGRSYRRKDGENFYHVLRRERKDPFL